MRLSKRMAARVGGFHASRGRGRQPIDGLAQALPFSAVALDMQELVLLPSITRQADHRAHVDRAVPVQHLCRGGPVWSFGCCIHQGKHASACRTRCLSLLRERFDMHTQPRAPIDILYINT